MLTFSFNTKQPLRILCIGAHCDDIEIGAGGTLLKIQDVYDVGTIKWVVLASNSVRKGEATRSAHSFLKSAKNEDINIQSWRDGFLPTFVTEIKDYFEEIKKDFIPDIIFTHFRDDRHQDHRLVSELTWNTWRNHLILEYEIPKYDGDLGRPNFFVPLEKGYIDQRINIILNSFISQHGKHWFDDETFKALPRLRGMESATNFAEAFYARKVLL